MVLGLWTEIFECTYSCRPGTEEIGMDIHGHLVRHAELDLELWYIQHCFLDSFKMAEKLFGHAFFTHQHLAVSGVDIHVVNHLVGLLFYQFL